MANLKSNISSITNAVTKVKTLSGVTYQWNENSDYSGEHDTGVIEQAVEDLALPGLVTSEGEDGNLSIRYEKLVPILIEAIKELSAKLLEWTNKRWIIAFSRENGLPTLKEKKKLLHSDLLKKESETELFKKVKKIFEDAELVKVEDENK